MHLVCAHVLAWIKHLLFFNLCLRTAPAKSGWRGLQAAVWKQRRASIQGLQTRVLPVFRNQKAWKYPPTPTPVSNRLGTKPESFVWIHGHIWRGDTESSLQEAQDPGAPVHSLLHTERFYSPEEVSADDRELKLAVSCGEKDFPRVFSSCVLRALNGSLAYTAYASLPGRWRHSGAL